jgi:hypothetical protein
VVTELALATVAPAVRQRVPVPATAARPTRRVRAQPIVAPNVQARAIEQPARAIAAPPDAPLRARARRAVPNAIPRSATSNPGARHKRTLRAGRPAWAAVELGVATHR